MLTTIRKFFTYSRAVGLVGLLTALFGILEMRGVFTNVPEPWATVVTCVGAVLAWAGRSGLADKKVVPPADEVPQ